MIKLLDEENTSEILDLCIAVSEMNEELEVNPAIKNGTIDSVEINHVMEGYLYDYRIEIITIVEKEEFDDIPRLLKSRGLIK